MVTPFVLSLLFLKQLLILMQETLNFKTKLILASLTYKNVSLRGYPEKFANQEFYPLKNYHKEWYDFEADSVMICPWNKR
jgi:hypothetical protein